MKSGVSGVIVQVVAHYGSKPILSFTAPRSRVISLADYNVEKRLVLAVPHRMLFGEPEELPLEPTPKATAQAARRRRPRDCPFCGRERSKYDNATFTPLSDTDPLQQA